MEFWGVEVKPGQKVKCEPGEDRLLHLSQAALGETKDKGAERVPIFVKVNDQKLVLGTLSAEKCAQISYDVVFDKEFELSHSSKNTSVYFCGYRSVLSDDQIPSDDDSLSDVDSEEDIQIAKNTNGKPMAKDLRVSKENLAAKKNAKAVEQIKNDKPKAGDDDDNEDDDDSEGESEDDEDMVDGMSDSDDEDEGSAEEEETPPKKAASGKRRSVDSASKTPVAAKKAKLVTPSSGKKTAGDGKKDGHVATPHVATPHLAKKGEKPKQKTPKSLGPVTCGSCSKRFNSETALQSHTKAKHSAAK